MESKLVNPISILKVSNSDPCFQDDDQTEKPMLENLQEPPSTTPSDHDHDQQDQPKKEEEQPKCSTDHINTPAKEERKTPSSPKQELINNINKDVEDDNDGFKTPTSLEHKIPVMKECPPAPKPPRKRKVLSPASSATGRKTLNLNPEQLEALFWPTFLFPDLSARLKKTRRDHHDDTK